MKRLFLFFILIISLFIVGCKSYSPEIKAELEICKKSIDYGECYLNLAIEQDDISICKFINNKYYKEVCKMMVNKEFDRCAEIDNWDYSERYPKMSDYDYDMKAYANAQVRATLTIPTKANTIKKCYTWSAILNQDANQCRNIENERDKDSCFRTLAVEMKDPFLCEQIVTDYIKELCLTEV